MDVQASSAPLQKVLLGLRRIGFAMSFGGRLKLPRSLMRRAFRYVRAVVTVTDFDGNMTMTLCLWEHMQRRIFWMGYYNSDIVAILDGLLTPGMMFVDVGANIGEITLAAAKRVGVTGKVFAFEPMDPIADRLDEHVRVNELKHVMVTRKALGDTIDDNVPIYISAEQHSGDENAGLGSLYGGTHGEAPAQCISITTLDVWLDDHPVERLDLIKIDIEGAELPCLRGAERSLRRFRPKLIIEIQNITITSGLVGYQPTDILDFLSGLDYEFYHIEEAGRLSPLTVSNLHDYQNVLCLPRSTG